jgi:hypothetical protein
MKQLYLRQEGTLWAVWTSTGKIGLFCTRQEAIDAYGFWIVNK